MSAEHITPEVCAKVRKIAERYVRRTPSLSVDDLVQEGLLGWLQGVRKYDPSHPSGASVSTYAAWYARRDMRRIGIGVTTEVVDGKRRQILDLPPAISGDVPDENGQTIIDRCVADGDPEREYARREMWLAVQGAGRDLPPRWARAVWLVYAEEWPITETAAHLGVSRNTLSAWLRRAVPRLRALLSDHRDAILG